MESAVRVPQSQEVAIRSFIRVNHKIRVSQVRCLGVNGDMLGVLATRDALRLAEQAGMDLVEGSPNADPPVCRIMDYGKFRYDESIKEKEARKHQHNRAVKEVKFHCSVAEHDYQTKLTHTRDFLQKGHKVKLTLQYRGRENAHRELGYALVNRLIKDCEGLATVEMSPRIMGRSLIAMLANVSQKHQAPPPSRPAPAVKPEVTAPKPASAPEVATDPVVSAPVLPPPVPAETEKKALDSAP